MSKMTIETDDSEIKEELEDKIEDVKEELEEDHSEIVEDIEENLEEIEEQIETWQAATQKVILAMAETLQELATKTDRIAEQQQEFQAAMMTATPASIPPLLETDTAPNMTGTETEILSSENLENPENVAEDQPEPEPILEQAAETLEKAGRTIIRI